VSVVEVACLASLDVSVRDGLGLFADSLHGG
jgi:hypothetical protein